MTDELLRELRSWAEEDWRHRPLFTQAADALEQLRSRVAELERIGGRMFADARRYQAWRDGDVVVRRAGAGGFEARSRDASHYDVRSWHVSESLDAAIDAAISETTCPK